MNQERMQQVLEKARLSKENDEHGIEPWRVTEHDDWLDVKREAVDGLDMLDIEDYDEDAAVRDQEISSEAALKKFNDDVHEGVEAVMGKDDTQIIVSRGSIDVNARLMDLDHIASSFENRIPGRSQSRCRRRRKDQRHDQ